MKKVKYVGSSRWRRVGNKYYERGVEMSVHDGVAVQLSKFEDFECEECKVVLKPEPETKKEKENAEN